MGTYREVLLELMKKNGYTKASLAKRLGVSRNTTSTALRGVEKDMSLSRFLKYCDAMGAKVVVEYTDPEDGRKNFRWQLTE